MSERAKPASSTSTRRGSKVDAFAHLLPHESDAVIAERAGVHPETVRIYRKRHTAAGARDSAPSARRPGPVSPIAPFEPLLGTQSDAEIARLAGVTRGAVYQYRRNRGIQATPGSPAADQKSAADAARPEKTTFVYIATVRASEHDTTYAILGETLVEATLKARAAVPDGRLVSVVEAMKVVA